MKLAFKSKTFVLLVFHILIEILAEMDKDIYPKEILDLCFECCENLKGGDPDLLWWLVMRKFEMIDEKDLCLKEKRTLPRIFEKLIE